MKLLTSIVLFIIMNATINAQNSFQLPSYFYGQESKTTVYHYFGPILNTGKASIKMHSSLSPKFVTGLKFYMFVDSIDLGGSPAAFKDSAGINVLLRKGDKLTIPASFQLYAGKIGFHIIIEGTPTMAGESYLCDIGTIFTTGENWEMYITAMSQKTCNVLTLIDGIESNQNKTSNVKIFPNPSSDQLVIETNFDKQGITYRIVDKLGKEVQNGLLTSQSTIVNIQKLISGDYLIEIGAEPRQSFKIIKN